MKVGIFGGTFNPIHSGHLRAAQEVKEELPLDKIIFIPSYIPPHKDLAGGVPGRKRLEIVKKAIESNPCFGVSGFEIESGGPSYSIKTIKHIKQRYCTTPYFILGQDAFNEISTWFEADKLFNFSHFVVMTRPGASKIPLSDILGDIATSFNPTKMGYINKKGNEIIFVEVTSLDISSSYIRDLCKKRKSIKYLVPEVVEEYIHKERVYL
ncbi:MAG: nicotinate-nucleotide adenylyltransferase [Deltaproteobacteria bacterium]|nr:nicotinate-nucleotide adenylyltransferase [Deltaproteobacteria bacterium]